MVQEWKKQKFSMERGVLEFRDSVPVTLDRGRANLESVKDSIFRDSKYVLYLYFKIR